MEQGLPEVNWQFLNKALEEYKKLGYRYVEVPWTIPRAATEVTYKADKYGWETSYGDLCGSSEQSLIHLLQTGKIFDKVPYVALTPCFRDEDAHTNLTRPYFMKVELGISTRDKEQTAEWLNMSAMVLMVMKTLSNGHGDFQQVFTSDFEGVDINLNGIEVGSFGYRDLGDRYWIYGTGLAEPRFSQALKVSP